MASGKEYLNFILEQLSGLEDITYRPMMGEYILYYRGRIFGGIYDDRLLVKPVPSAVAFVADAKYELPYDGAKPMLLVENVDSREFMAQLVDTMYAELTPTKKKVTQQEIYMNNIFSRVSIRKYQDRPVETEKTMAILKAAMQAPSATNQQPWEFYVVTSKEKLEALSRVHPYAGMTKDAPVAIVAAYRSDCRLPDYAQIDLSIAMENLWLETNAQGLGGVWLGISPMEERMKDVEKILSLPENHRAFAIFPYGYPAEERQQQDRFDPDRIHFVE